MRLYTYIFAYIIEEDLDLVCITETWISEEKFNDLIIEYALDGYELYTYERKDKHGGGVLVYIKDLYTSTLIDVAKDDMIEAIWLEIKSFLGNCIRLGIFYRPPDQSREFDILMCQEIARGCSTSMKSFVIGDFNYPDINWENMEVKNVASQIFIDCILDNFLCQSVSKSTRQDTILDLVVVEGFNSSGCRRNFGFQ